MPGRPSELRVSLTPWKVCNWGFFPAPSLPEKVSRPGLSLRGRGVAWLCREQLWAGAAASGPEGLGVSEAGGEAEDAGGLAVSPHPGCAECAVRGPQTSRGAVSLGQLVVGMCVAS